MNQQSLYLGRRRGRRVALLLASALPLLAVDDVEVQQQQRQHQQHDTMLPMPKPSQLYSKEPADHADENDWNDDANDFLLSRSKKRVAQQQQQDVIFLTDDGADFCIVSSSAVADAADADSESSHDDENDDNDNQCLSATQRLLEDETLTSLPALMPQQLDKNYWMLQQEATAAAAVASTDDGAMRYHNTVIPFRPFFDHEPRGEATSSSSVHSNSSSNQNITATSTSSSGGGGGSASIFSEVALSPPTNNITETNNSPQEGVNNNNNAINTVNHQTEEEQVDVLPSPTLAVPTADTSTTETNDNDNDVDDGDDDDHDNDDDDEPVIVDYASKSAGALILEKSSGWKGVSNLLNSDKDQYAMIPIAHRNKSIVIGLSEDILLEQIVLANYERYSSHVRDFVVFGSQTMETWVDLGTYTAKPGNGKQRFEFQEPKRWARYLKIVFQRHYGDEHYLTVSQISIHGRTMLQGFHEEWDEEEQLQQQEAAAIAAATASAENAVALEDAATDASSSTILINNQDAVDHHHHHHAVQDDLCRAKLQEGDCTGSLSFEKKMRLFSFLNEPEWEALNRNSAVYINASSAATGGHRRISTTTTSMAETQEQVVITEIPRASVANALFTKSSGGSSENGVMMHSVAAGVRIGFNMTSTPSRYIKEIQAKLRQRHGLAVKIPKIYNQRAQEPSGSTLTADESADQELIMVHDKLPPEDTMETNNPTDAKKTESDLTTPLPTASTSTAPHSTDKKATAKKALDDDALPAETGTAGIDIESFSAPTSGKPLSEATLEPSASSKNENGGKTKQSTASTSSTTKSSPPVTATAPTTTTSTTDDAADDSLLETNTALTKLLERFPSASCLEKLDFARFKTKILQARPQRSQHGGSGSGNPGASMEPIFKKLTDEIRTLQTSLNVHDQFARESAACYQGLLLELLVEQETLRLGHEERLAKLEEDVHDNLAWLVAISRFVSSPVTFVVKSILGFCVHSLYVILPAIVSGLALSISSILPRIMTLISSAVDHTAATAAVDYFQQGAMELFGAAGRTLVLFTVVLVCAVVAGPVRRLRLRLSSSSSNGNSTIAASTTARSTAAAAPSSLPLKKQQQEQEQGPPPPPLAPLSPPTKQLPKQQQPLQLISNRDKKKSKPVASNKKHRKENTQTTDGMYRQ